MRPARPILIPFLAMLLTAATARAQEEAHYEGYSMGSNPAVVGTPLSGRGLLTELYPPLVRDFILNEYTWVVAGLTSLGPVLKDSVYYTNYDVSGSSFSIYEDATQNSRGTFYNCPSDIVGADGRYADGALYLRGHFLQFQATFDIHGDTYGQGTYTARLNWDSGAHLGDLPFNKHGGWTFGGTSTSIYTCIPAPTAGSAPYEQALTGRIFQTTTPSGNTSWGRVRRFYR